MNIDETILILGHFSTKRKLDMSNLRIEEVCCYKFYSGV